ncbi:MAG TPA: helix-turn-helix transcriptional regulator [Acidimicrobiales bacterium]|nr:helix-turn-helix transcriptional regulator [Acidimicrobiales bacterium]
MAGDLGEVLRAARERAGLRQEDVAVRAGVDQSVVSVYENGRRSPTWGTFRRLLTATGAVAEVRAAELPASPAVSIAEMASYLSGANKSRRRRLALEFLSRYEEGEVATRWALLLDRPEPTGDPRWDALLGAMAEHLAFHDDVDPPAWASDPDRFLVAAWFWIDLPSVRERALIGAPSAFRRRNVWVDRADLQRV